MTYARASNLQSCSEGGSSIGFTTSYYMGGGF